MSLFCTFFVSISIQDRDEGKFSKFTVKSTVFAVSTVCRLNQNSWNMQLEIPCFWRLFIVVIVVINR